MSGDAHTNPPRLYEVREDARTPRYSPRSINPERARASLDLDQLGPPARICVRGERKRTQLFHVVEKSAGKTLQQYTISIGHDVAL